MTNDQAMAPIRDASDGMKRPYLRSEDRHRQILDAAGKVVQREGLSGLTMVAVADEAGISRRLLYNHFPDLQKLLIDYVMGELRPYVVRTAGEFVGPGQDPRLLGRTISENVRLMPRAHRHLLIDVLNERHSPDLLAVREQVISTITDRWSQLLPQEFRGRVDRARIQFLALVVIMAHDLTDRGEATPEQVDQYLTSLGPLVDVLSEPTSQYPRA